MNTKAYYLLFLFFATGVPHAETLLPINEYLLGSRGRILSYRTLPFRRYGAKGAGDNTEHSLTSSIGTKLYTSAATANFIVGINERLFIPSGSSNDRPIYDAKHLFVAILLVITLLQQRALSPIISSKTQRLSPPSLGMTMENPHANAPCGLDGRPLYCTSILTKPPSYNHITYVSFSYYNVVS